MKKWISLLLVLSLLTAIAGCSSKPAAAGTPSASASATNSASPSATPEAAKYKDGTYTYESSKDGEGYYAKASATIKDGKIETYEMNIYDSKNGDRVFDETYEEVMPSEIYKQQCRDDLKGFNTYKAQLIEKQDPDQVDAISKATWTYNWFTRVTKQLLKQASGQ
ncbi:MAG: FMN-binding protein [Clostridia bacterium]|nr:FMN-binding protein [Clostridia bacterium]